MSKAITYSLFGFDRAKHPDCFDFHSLLRGLMICLRFNRMVYPEFQTILQIDHASYNGYPDLFKQLTDRNILRIEKNPNGAQLCEAMLWRLKPVYWRDAFGKWEFTHVLCRDLDSPSVYREAQAVQAWINNDRSMHAITDSVSHDVALMGGMIGVRPESFTGKTNTNSFHELMSLNKIDLSNKGSDQVFLNEKIYPCVGQKGNESITQHYFKGRGNSWLHDFHTCSCWLDTPALGHKDNCPENIPLSIPIELKDTDECVQHIGSSGWNGPKTDAWMHKYKDRFEDLLTIEKQYPKIFLWANG